MIPATQWDSIIEDLDPETADEIRPESLANVMSEPPGPIKTRVWWTERCPSGLPEQDQDA